MVTLTHKTGISREPLQGTSYQVRLSEGGQDSEWDAYVASRPGGHHTQSSLWGAVKSAGGWRAVHLVVKDRGRVVAGGQLLTRPFKFGLRVGYVANGPLYPTGNPALGALVLDELLAACRSQRVGFLVIQPPQNGEPVTEQLIGRGFGPSWFELAPIATVLIDLVPDSAEILACMKRQTRQNIRRSEERGVVVAEGEESDLPVFHRLYAATSERHGTHPYSLQYFQTMWRILEPFGMLKLFVAAIEGEPVCALLTIPFGHSVVASKLGWSGLHGDCRPSEALFWAAIRWAKAAGYGVFDFDGINVEGAKAVLAGRPLPEHLSNTHTRLKLSFGGEVVLNPGPYDDVRIRPLRWMYRAARPRLATWPPARRRLWNYVQSV